MRRSADVGEEISQVGGGLELDFAVVRVVHYGRDIGVVQLRPSDLENWDKPVEISLLHKAINIYSRKSLALRVCSRIAPQP